MSQAIVQIGPSQYIISPGEEILVSGYTKDIPVLLYEDADQITVGRPYIPAITIKFEVLGKVKGKKVRVSKYKAKSRYRRTYGSRPLLTRLKVADIVVKKKP